MGRFVCALFFPSVVWQCVAYAEAPLLLRDAPASVRTFAGTLPVHVARATTTPDVTVLVLADTLQPGDLSRLRRDFATLQASFLKSHPFRTLTVSGTVAEASSILRSPSDVTIALARIEPGVQTSKPSNQIAVLCEAAKGLPDRWSTVIIVGRLPAVSVDETWAGSWFGEVYRTHRLRVNFWSLDGGQPAWALNLSASTQGVLSTENLRSVIANVEETPASLFEVTWQTSLNAGAHAYSADLADSAGNRIFTVQTVASAPGFTLPLEPYLEARKAMAASSSRDTDSANAVLLLNPSDVDALRKLGATQADQKQFKAAMDLWARASEILADDASVWAELAKSAYYASNYDKAEKALVRARQLGASPDELTELDARLRVQRGDYSGALPLLEKVLAASKDNQALWLLKATCAQHSNRWSTQAESIERAAALGEIPLESRSALIAGYLAHASCDRALPHLRAASRLLPPEAGIHAEYAEFWKQAGDGPTAEKLWKEAIDIDRRCEPAYFGLAEYYLESKRAGDCVRSADLGLAAVPESARLALLKTDALEVAGDAYSARRFLNTYAAEHPDRRVLERRARLEDWYGTGDSDAYAAVVSTLIEDNAPQNQVIAACRRGLEVALRSERIDVAREFAKRLNNWGDPSGLALLSAPEPSHSVSTTELLGGTDALAFLVLGRTNIRKEDFFVEYSRALSADARGQTKKTFLQKQQSLREFFAGISALAALGIRRPDRIEISLSWKDKPGRQRTEKAFSILGLKLNKSKAGLVVSAAEAKSGANRQDTLAALAVDDQAIQSALNTRGKFILNIPIDHVPIFPAEAVWKTLAPRGHSAGALAELLASDPRLPTLCMALNSMDQKAAETLLRSAPLGMLADKYSALLAEFSPALALDGGRAEVPGGRAAGSIWTQLVGVNPASPAAFFQALLDRDQGKMIEFFYTLSELDWAHQRFFTRSAERTKRLYDLFRETPGSQVAVGIQLGSTSFLEFLREVPLNDDGTVAFPGSPDIWMVAKGGDQSAAALAKLIKKARKVAADDEDAVLLRLGRTEYKVHGQQRSELQNFVAVARVDALREIPMSAESALLLAQNYASYGPLYAYLGGLGDLEASDLSNIFAVERKIEMLDPETANTRSGEFHSLLALFCLAELSRGDDHGSDASGQLLPVFRKAIERYAQAQNSPDWVTASLTSFDELLQTSSIHDKTSRDAALERLLFGDDEELTVQLPAQTLTVNPVAQRRRAYQGVLDLQKVPPLDALYAIRDALENAQHDPESLNVIQRQLDAFPVLAEPKGWNRSSDAAAKKKALQRYQTAECHKLLAKLREKLGRKRHNPDEVEKLSKELLGYLEPWTELAFAGKIYARYLEPSDLIVSDDPFLLRKHEFVELGSLARQRTFLTASAFLPESQGEGSYFTGGFAEFSLAAGQARAAGNHLGGSFGGALYASLRGTDWRSLTPASLQGFGTRVRLAREWIVQSATSEPMLSQLEEQSFGLLSLTRRANLINGIKARDWKTVWNSTSISDLCFLGDSLAANAPDSLWNNPALRAMKRVVAQTEPAHPLGQVAPHLGGGVLPALRRYEPYEEYQRYILPDRIAERTAELKLYLAWQVDTLAWPPGSLAALAGPAADAALRRLQVTNQRDWALVLEAYRSFNQDSLGRFLAQ